MSGDAASKGASSSSNAGASSSSVVRVLLVRHGETQHNVDGIIQGQLDTDLNPFGRLQAQLTGEHLSTVHIDEVYASPLKRARDTALYIIGQNKSLQAASAPHLHTDARLMERYFGELQGSRRYDGHEPRDAEPIEQVWKRLASFWSQVVLADVRPANGTSPPTTSHTKPLQPALHKIPDARSTYQNIPAITPAAVGAQSFARTVVLVSHGSALKNLIRGVLIPNKLAEPAPEVREPRGLGNCSITEIHIPLPRPAPSASSSRTGIIVRWSDVSHLPRIVKEQLVANVDERVDQKIDQDNTPSNKKKL